MAGHNAQPRQAPSQSGPRPATSAAPAMRPTTADVDAFVTAVLGPDEASAEAVVRDLLAAGVPVERMYLNLFAPAAQQLGSMWDDDACDFLQVTDALGRVQRVLHLLDPCWLQPTAGNQLAGRALLACPPGEQHTLGVFVVADFFARDGWDVRVGPPLDRLGLVDVVASQHVDVVGFSVGCATRLPRLAHDISHVRKASLNRRLIVLVGGPPFVADAGLVARVGADGTAPSADEAPRVARALLFGRSTSGAHPPPA
jgi:methanogenic corrinoid protein MtbC1